MIFQLGAFIRIQLTNMFSLSSFIEDFKGGRKKIFKNIGYLCLVLYLIVIFGSITAIQTYTFYIGFKPLGRQSLCLYSIFFYSSVFSFFFGFLHAVSMYMIGTEEENLLVLPVKPVVFFSGKWISSYIFQLPLVLLIVFIGCGIYGFYEKLLLSPFFYITVILGGLSIPLIPYCFIYIILIIVFTVGKNIRIKKILHFFSSLVMIFILILVTQKYNQVINFIGNSNQIQKIFFNNGILSVLCAFSWYLPMQWFVNSILYLSDSSIVSLFNIFFLIFVSIFFTVVLIKLLSPFYRKSITGFNESSAKKMKKSEIKVFIKKDMKASSIFKSLLTRDFVNMIREPVFFINGPFMIILFPLIICLSVCFVMQGTSVSENISAIFKDSMGHMIDNSQILFWITIVGSFFGIFLGSISGVGATCFSREGRGIQILKALPIDPYILADAKISHVDIYSVFSAIIVDCMASVVMHVLPASFCLGENLLSMLFITILTINGAACIQIVDMFIDTVNPKLDWDTPHQAIRQNINSIIGSFLPVGIIILLAAVVAYLPHNQVLIIVLIIIITLIRVILTYKYKKFLEKCYYYNL